MRIRNIISTVAALALALSAQSADVQMYQDATTGQVASGKVKAKIVTTATLSSGTTGAVISGTFSGGTLASPTLSGTVGGNITRSGTTTGGVVSGGTGVGVSTFEHVNTSTIANSGTAATLANAGVMLLSATDAAAQQDVVFPSGVSSLDMTSDGSQTATSENSYMTRGLVDARGDLWARSWRHVMNANNFNNSSSSGGAFGTDYGFAMITTATGANAYAMGRCWASTPLSDSNGYVLWNAGPIGVQWHSTIISGPENSDDSVVFGVAVGLANSLGSSPILTSATDAHIRAEFRKSAAAVYEARVAGIATTGTTHVSSPWVPYTRDYANNNYWLLCKSGTISLYEARPTIGVAASWSVITSGTLSCAVAGGPTAAGGKNGLILFSVTDADGCSSSSYNRVYPEVVLTYGVSP